MIRIRKISIIYLYQILVLLTPILNNYRLLPVEFIYIVCGLGFCLFLYMVSQQKIKIEGKSLIYALYVILFLVLYAVLSNEVPMVSIIARTAYFLLIFINFYVFAYQVWDYERCFRLYKTICLFVSILIIIQFLLGHLGMGISLIPPGLTTNTVELTSTDVYRATQVIDRRFSTFFLEPAHQAQYCLPCLALLLFSGLNTSKRTMFSALILTAGLLTTTSMQGILGAGIVWIMYLIIMIREEKIKGFGRLIVLIPIAIVAVYFLGSQTVLQEQFQKKILSFNSGNIYRGTSLYVRIIYGWDCFKEIGVLQKIIGYGYSNSGTYLLTSGIGLRFTTRELISYMSGISKMFCEIGILGVFLNFRIMLFPLLRKQNGKRDLRIIGLLLSVIVIMFTSAAFDSISSLLPITFALSLYLNKTRDERGLYIEQMR